MKKWDEKDTKQVIRISRNLVLISNASIAVFLFTIFSVFQRSMFWIWFFGVPVPLEYNSVTGLFFLGLRLAPANLALEMLIFVVFYFLIIFIIVSFGWFSILLEPFKDLERYQRFGDAKKRLISLVTKWSGVERNSAVASTVGLVGSYLFGTLSYYYVYVLLFIHGPTSPFLLNLLLFLIIYLVFMLLGSYLYLREAKKILSFF
jgi:hypothetical protein